MTLKTFLILLIIGFGVATVSVYYSKRFLGGLVRALLNIDATSPESAISLEEINFKLSPALRYSLRPGTDFSATVIRTEDNRYYIAPEKVAKAKAKYRDEGITIFFVLIMLVLFFAAALAATYVFPEVLGFAQQRFDTLFR